MMLAVLFAIGLGPSAHVHAQFGFGPFGPPPVAGGFVPWRGPAFFPLHPRPFFGPPVAGIPLAPFGWGGFWGGGTTIIISPPLIISPPAIIVVAGNNSPAAPSRDDGLPPREPIPVGEEGPRGAKPGDHLVIRPRKGEPAPPLVFPLPAAPAVKNLPPVPIDPFAVRKPVNIEKAEPDRVKELARLVKLGEAAFAAGEFGRAAEHFDRATAIDPRAALPHFLKAQAVFASGGFAEAVKAIRAGLALDPAWPAGKFDPRELYGGNPAAFAGHLEDLEKAVAANPGEATLEFLLGYELWFLGKRVEARKFFAAAEKRLGDPDPIALFK
jgi:hypothetical protein